VSAPPLPAAVTLGTRASALARAQTELVAGHLGVVRPGIACSTRVISTTGDRTQDSGEPLPSIGGKGLFVKELETALHEGAIESTVLPRNPLDVLAQQLVAMAVMDRWTVAELLEVVTRAVADDAFDARLDLLGAAPDSTQ